MQAKNGLKKCSACRDDFPSTPKFFYKNKAYRDKLDTYCKTCRKEKSRNKNLPRKPERETKQQPIETKQQPFDNKWLLGLKIEATICGLIEDKNYIEKGYNNEKVNFTIFNDDVFDKCFGKCEGL